MTFQVCYRNAVITLRTFVTRVRGYHRWEECFAFSSVNVKYSDALWYEKLMSRTMSHSAHDAHYQSVFGRWLFVRNRPRLLLIFPYYLSPFIMSARLAFRAGTRLPVLHSRLKCGKCLQSSLHSFTSFIKNQWKRQAGGSLTTSHFTH